MPGKWLELHRQVGRALAPRGRGRQFVTALAGAMAGAVVLALVLWQVTLPVVVARSPAWWAVRRR